MQWCDTDKPENYRSGVYGRDSICYRFNSHGLRSRELERVPNKINILVSGCSHTIGIGLPEYDTWPHFLSEFIPDSVIHNVAVGGSSSDYVTRSIWIATRSIKVDAIFVLWPDPSRFEYFDNAGPKRMLVMDPAYPELLLNDHHHRSNLQKNIIMTKLLAGSIPLYYADTALGRSPSRKSRARDGIHNCRTWHESVARGFYIKYLENDRDSRFSTAQHIMDYEQQNDHK